jgi:DNA modification methylase
MHFLKHGFRYCGRITIETDVVRENNQTYRLGWTEQCKDGSKMGVGCPEYILLFRKLPTDTSKAYADNPVVKNKKDYTRGKWQIDARSKWNSSGDRFLTREEISQLEIDKINKYYTEYMKNNVYDYDKHVNQANEMDEMSKLPATFQTLNIPSRSMFVWDDVNRMLTLNSAQSQKKLNMHICPLQFDIVDRLINRFSNKGEVVFDPFGGLGTVPFRAIKLGRYGICTELNHESYKDGLFYLRKAESEMIAPKLFDVI